MGHDPSEEHWADTHRDDDDDDDTFSPVPPAVFTNGPRERHATPNAGRRDAGNG